jgi:hypothetical protein
MNPTIHSLLRFWWLVLAGLILGVLAGYLTLNAKTNKKYVATSQIFVNAPSDPYLRTQQPQVTRQNARSRIVRVPGKSTGTGPSTTVQSIPSPPVVISEAPDTETLVNAANLYPLFVESDDVAKIHPAPASCKIEATGIFASTNTFGVFKSSPVPVVQVKSTCKTKSDAIPSTLGRVAAFRLWIVNEQNAARIPRHQRLLVTLLTSPTDTRTLGGPSAGLPVFVGVVVLLLFCGLAILLDRPRPAAEPEPQQQKKSQKPPEAKA